jgi:hypothetical protein
LHICPETGSHVPAALQAWFAGHTPWEPAGNVEQVFPSWHAWHGPLHATAQQVLPVEQKPLAQSAPIIPATHGCPSTAAHVCVALQPWFVPQSVSFKQATQAPAPSHKMPPAPQ